jgi:hypothetical protein
MGAVRTCSRCPADVRGGERPRARDGRLRSDVARWRGGVARGPGTEQALERVAAAEVEEEEPAEVHGPHPIRVRVGDRREHERVQMRAARNRERAEVVRAC